MLKVRSHDSRVPNLSQQRQHPSLVTLGATIRRAREAKGMSQEALALAAEVDRSYLGRIERGDNNAALLTLLRIAEALNCSLSDLLRESQL